MLKVTSNRSSSVENLTHATPTRPRYAGGRAYEWKFWMGRMWKNSTEWEYTNNSVASGSLDEFPAVERMHTMNSSFFIEHFRKPSDW